MVNIIRLERAHIMRYRTPENVQLFYDVQNERLRIYDATSKLIVRLARFYAQLQLQI